MRYYIGEKTKDRLIKGLDKLDGLSSQQAKPERHARKEPGFFARITGNTATTHTNRYRYSFEQVTFDFATTEWATTDEGVTGTDNAVNILEGGNPDSGLLASGVDTTSPNYPSTYTMQPIGTGAIVRMHKSEDASETSWFWFEAINTDFGPCP